MMDFSLQNEDAVRSDKLRRWWFKDIFYEIMGGKEGYKSGSTNQYKVILSVLHHFAAANARGFEPVIFRPKSTAAAAAESCRRCAAHITLSLNMIYSPPLITREILRHRGRFLQKYAYLDKLWYMSAKNRFIRHVSKFFREFFNPTKIDFVESKIEGKRRKKILHFGSIHSDPFSTLNTLLAILRLLSWVKWLFQVEVKRALPPF